MKYRVIVADDNGMYRAGFRSVVVAELEETEVLEARSLSELEFLVTGHGSLDAVFVEPSLPGLASVAPLRALQRANPNSRFVILSGSASRNDVLRCIGAGFSGFISKRQADSEVVAAVRDVLAGRIYVPPMTGRVSDLEPSGFWESLPHVEPGRGALKLTSRQREVLTLLSHGLSNKEIARKLNIAEATTKIHAAGLLRVLGVRNRTEAAVMARNVILHVEE